MWKGSPWKVDTTHASFITAGNSGETPVAANMALISSDGKFRYELPERTLAPDEQIWVDVRELIRNRVPDRNGKVLPADMTTGTYEIWQTKYRALGQLFEGKLIVDKTYGHAMYGCGGCCGLGDSYQVLDPYQDIIGGTHYQQVWGQNGCTGGYYDVTSDVWMWTSYSTDIASVSDGGMVTGLAPGGATIESRVNTEIGPRCEPIEILQYAQVEVKPHIDSISPSVALVGSNDVEITIDGSGFESPTVDLPSGFTQKSQASTSSRIIITVDIGINTPVSNVNLTVTANGETSNPKPFLADGPHHMVVQSDVSGHCSGCTTTVDRLVNYQIFNLSGSSSGTLGIGEAITDGPWTCSQPDPGSSTASCTNPYSAVNGNFYDLWSLASDGYTPLGCGNDIVDHWQWCSPSPDWTIGTLTGFLHNNATRINGYTNPPNPMPYGTVINP